MRQNTRDKGEKTMNAITTTTSFGMAVRTVREGATTLLAPLGRHINNWVAAAIARRERQAAMLTLRSLRDRQPPIKSAAIRPTP
jgi:hypothetical protein